MKAFLSGVLLPILVAGVFALLFRSLYYHGGVIDLPLAWIFIGLPFGISQMRVWILPKHCSLSGAVGIFALSILLGGVIGGFVFIYRVMRGILQTLIGA